MHPDIFSQYASRYDRTREEEYTVQEYLELCKHDPGGYATASERMLSAIGAPELLDTRHDQRLSRIFSNTRPFGAASVASSMSDRSRVAQPL